MREVVRKTSFCLSFPHGRKVAKGIFAEVRSSGYVQRLRMHAPKKMPFMPSRLRGNDRKEMDPEFSKSNQNALTGQGNDPIIFAVLEEIMEFFEVVAEGNKFIILQRRTLVRKGSIASLKFQIVEPPPCGDERIVVGDKANLTRCDTNWSFQFFPQSGSPSFCLPGNHLAGMKFIALS